MSDSTTIAFPEHYSAEDIANIATIQKWMADNSYSQASLARLARISPSTLSPILNGTYPVTPSPKLASVMPAIRHADESNGDKMAAVETSVYKLAFTACQMARRYRNFAVLAAAVGTGKTFSLKDYKAQHPNTHMIEATPTMSPRTLINLLARVIAGVDGKGSQDDKFRAIIDALKDTDSLLIVDEAETMNPKQLHCLRRIRDLANVGVVLAGTEYLTALIKPQHGQFDQIRSRTGFWPETIKNITKEDAAALIQSAFGAEEVLDDVIERLYAYSRGSARMLVEGLIAGVQQFRKDRALDVKLIDAVASQALCLQIIK